MSETTAQPEKLFTFKSGGWVLLLSFFFMLVAAGLVLYPVLSTGGFHRMKGDGHHVDTYGFDLSNLTIAKEMLVASGHSKDQILSIPEKLVETITPGDVDLIAQNEHIRFLVPADRVIGLVINGISRAYPLRVLDLHELVNDTLGGTPLAVSYSPLTDSAVVFDRRVNGESAPVEFGVSGIMLESNTIYFDRRSDSARESLWPQLALKAICGPAAGKPMTLIPYELTTWDRWKKAHPDTRVLLGLRTHKRQYSGDHYSTYIASDELLFTPTILWNGPNIPRKTPIIVSSSDAIHWIAQTFSSTSPVPSAPHQIHTYLFAWYAQHSTDTDYTGIKSNP